MRDHVVTSHAPIVSALRESVKRHSRPSERVYPQTRGMEKLAQRLKRLRKTADLTQPQLAKAASVPGSTIAEIETGVTQNPTFETLKKLAAFFEVNEEWLLTGKGQPQPVSSMRDEESELLLLFRALSSPGKEYMLSRIRDLHADEHRARPEAPSPGGRRDDHGKRSKPN